MSESKTEKPESTALASGPLTSAELVTRNNLSAAVIARAIATDRAEDPLGLGVQRPPAPPDPDAYDEAVERREFALSLLSDEERRELEQEPSRFMSIGEVRALFAKNMTSATMETAGVDPELIMFIDVRVNYKIFLADGNVYTREELYANFPFHEFNVQPEAIFAQQELGVFPPRKTTTGSEPEYIARDVGSEVFEFLAIEDLVGRAARPGYELRRPPLRVARTKVYVGRERWDDFRLLQRMARGATRIAQAQIAYGSAARGADAAGAVVAFAHGALGFGARTNLQAIESGEDIRRREEEVRRREEELRRREEEQSARIALVEERAEKLMALMARLDESARGQPRGTERPAPDDAVPI